MHANGIIYRDVKPDNICFLNDYSDTIKLVDFGSATFINNNEWLNEPFGVSYYMAPELIEKNYN